MTKSDCDCRNRVRRRPRESDNANTVFLPRSLARRGHYFPRKKSRALATRFLPQSQIPYPLAPPTAADYVRLRGLRAHARARIDSTAWVACPTQGPPRASYRLTARHRLWADPCVPARTRPQMVGSVLWVRHGGDVHAGRPVVGSPGMKICKLGGWQARGHARS